MSQYRSSFDLPPAPEAPAAARRLAGLLLRPWRVVDADAQDAALLVVSELVTNALQHAPVADSIHVSFELSGEELVVAVADPSPLVPRQRVASADEEDGRGLSIIEAVAARWGVEPGPAHGKRVYAVLPLDPARCA